MTNKIEQRFLTYKEFKELMLSASENETKYLFELTQGFQHNPYKWLIGNALEKEGLIINNKPVYFGVLTRDYHIWTVVNTKVKEQFTLFKIAKQVIKKWSKYGNIYATMRKDNPKNIEWTKRLGFKIINETDIEITFLFQGDK